MTGPRSPNQKIAKPGYKQRLSDYKLHVLSAVPYSYMTIQLMSELR